MFDQDYLTNTVPGSLLVSSDVVVKLQIAFCGCEEYVMQYTANDIPRGQPQCHLVNAERKLMKYCLV